MRSITTLLLALFAAQAVAQEISGRVLDNVKEPLPNAIVVAWQNGVMRGGCTTDYDGNFMIKPLDPGKYDLITFYQGYDTIKVTSVIVDSGQRTTQNFAFNKMLNAGHPTMVIKAYKRPLVDYDKPAPHILTKEEIDKVPSTKVY